MLNPRNCRICGRRFKLVHAREELCPGCWHKQPKCGSCRIVMASQYGSLEGFARILGKYSICTGCNYEIRRKGFLHISETQWLYPSGRVKVRRAPIEDRFS